ncbi:MAG TPA: CCA tRNA nucleotidyltransferase, partial [Mycobacteriales bacterium]|nr:CCA tRNA nucleotidyltransferase [Mycobacteriales bacterium]
MSTASSIPSPDGLPPSAQARLAEMVHFSPAIIELGKRFQRAGYQLHLVGGSVRDAVLGRPTNDTDLCTDAVPDVVVGLIDDWAEATWTTGIAFGTVGAARHGERVEITTFRADSYDRVSRNPEVRYGRSLVDDLARRDFTINAMAVSVPDRRFTDPYGGLVDLAERRLRTPGAPTESFSDDPLRMLRAARFVAQLEVSVDEDVIAAMSDMAEELSRVTAERMRDEFSKLLCGADPVAGIRLLVHTGLADQFLPEIPGMQLTIDEHHQHKDVYEHSLTVLSQAI